MAWARWSTANLGEWVSFTPTLTASTNPTYGTSPTRWGIYCQVGKLVVAHFRIAFGASMTAGSGTWYLTPPVTARTSGTENRPIGTAVTYDNSLAQLAIVVPLLIVSSGKIQFDYGYSAGYGTVNNAAPMAWAQSDQLQGFLAYEAA